MSDSDNPESTPLDQLLQAHRKEKKDLQVKLQTLKKSATKGDKKKKKEVTEEIARLESEQNDKHAREIAELKSTIKVEEANEDENTASTEEKIKVGRAQRRRDKKACEAKERDERIRLQEKENVHGVRNKEISAIKKILKERDFMIHEIPSDGNCLYWAVLHQVPICSVTDLRKRTANVMLEQPDEYLPYLTSKKTEEMMTREEFAEYCNTLATTTCWGGQVEVRALTQIIQSPIEIVQATGPSILLGEEFKDSGKHVILCYHRHMYRSGAHYNSVQKLEDSGENEGGGEFQEPK